MSNESLREQMVKIRKLGLKTTAVVANPNRPATLLRPQNKVKKRVIISATKQVLVLPSGVRATPVAAATGWPEKARGKIAHALRATNALSAVGIVKSEPFDAALDEVYANINAIRKKAVLEAEAGPNRELTAIRRDSETVLNLVRTIREGKRVNDIEAEHIKPLSSQLASHLKQLRSSVIVLATPKVIRHEQVDQLVNEQNVAAFRVRYKRQLDTALHEHRNDPYFTIHQPVLPVFDGIVKSSLLLDAGLPVEDMAGYPVLLHQLLVVVNPEVIAKRGIDRDDYVRRLLGKINERSNQKFMSVTELGQANVREHIYYYWLMPEAAYKSMTTAGGHEVSVKQWGLAF